MNIKQTIAGSVGSNHGSPVYAFTRPPSFRGVRCLAGWIDNGFWSYSTLDPFLYPVLSSTTKIMFFPYN